MLWLAEKNGMDNPSVKKCKCVKNKNTDKGHRGVGNDVRVSIEPSTIKAIMGWRAMASTSSWVCSGSCSALRRLCASVETKTALTPI